MKQPFYPEINKPCFIKGINKKAVVKEVAEEKVLLTYFSRDTDKRITAWFNVSQVEEYRPKKRVLQNCGYIDSKRIAQVHKNEMIFSKKQAEELLKSAENVSIITKDAGKKIGDILINVNYQLNQSNDDVLYFAKVKPTAIIPSKRKEDGCYDIYADQSIDEIVIKPGEIKEVPTGIATAFSYKYRLDFQRERGSTGSIGLVPRCGQIDSGYRGEIFLQLQNVTDNFIVLTNKEEKVVFNNSGGVDYVLYPIAKAVCQAALEIVPDVEEKEIPYEELEKIPSQRGKGKLGDSGK